jgi:hypothetical protein
MGSRSRRPAAATSARSRAVAPQSPYDVGEDAAITQRCCTRFTLTARTFSSMCVEPILVLEQRTKHQRNLPIMISLGARWKRAGRAQNAAPMLKKFRLAVERSIYWHHASNRRHGSHLFAFHSPVMPVSKRVCHFELRVADQYGSLSKIMIAMDVQNGPQSVENSHKCSIGINITERRMLVSFGCVCVQAPLGCRAQEDKLAPALPPRWGRCFECGLRKIPARKGWCFQC